MVNRLFKHLESCRYWGLFFAHSRALRRTFLDRSTLSRRFGCMRGRYLWTFCWLYHIEPRHRFRRLVINVYFPPEIESLDFRYCLYRLSFHNSASLSIQHKWRPRSRRKQTPSTRLALTLAGQVLVKNLFVKCDQGLWELSLFNQRLFRSLVFCALSYEPLSDLSRQAQHILCVLTSNHFPSRGFLSH